MSKKDGYKTKGKILQVAKVLFAEKGFDGTSIENIAKVAGVNKGLIYFHFKDKNDIVISNFRNIIEEIGDFLDLSFVEENIENSDEDTEIQKIYEVDPLTCAKCFGKTKLISAIEDEEIIKKILKHLDLWEVKPMPPPKTTGPQKTSEYSIDYSTSKLPMSDKWIYVDAEDLEVYRP